MQIPKQLHASNAFFHVHNALISTIVLFVTPTTNFLMNSAIQRAQSAFINQQIKNANLALKTARYAKAKQSA